MARPLTHRRHGRHRSYDRLNRRTDSQTSPGLGQDAQRFVDEQQVRLDTAEGSEGIFDAMHLEQGEDEFSTFEQVQETNDPVDLGLTPSAPPFQTQSLDLDGSTEHLQSATQISPPRLGIGDTFTIAMWVKPSAQPLAGADSMLRLQSVSDGSAVSLAQRSAGASPEANGIQFIILDSVATIRQNIAWGNVWTAGTLWRHVVIQWNGIPGRRLFFDGADRGVGTVLTANSAIVVSDAINRFVQFGEFNPQTGTNYNGRIASIAMWPTILTGPEITAIFNGRSINFNLNANSGGYTSAASLVHWWELGKNVAPNLAADSAFPANPFNLTDLAVGIDDSDRVADVP